MALFFHNFQQINLALIFRAFGRETQIIVKFWEIFEN